MVILIVLCVSAVAGFFCLHKVQEFLTEGRKFGELDPTKKQMVLYTLVGKWPALFLALYTAQQLFLSF